MDRTWEYRRWSLLEHMSVTGLGLCGSGLSGLSSVLNVLAPAIAKTRFTAKRGTATVMSLCARSASVSTKEGDLSRLGERYVPPETFL